MTQHSKIVTIQRNISSENTNIKDVSLNIKTSGEKIPWGATPTRIIELVCKFVRHLVIKRFLRSFVFCCVVSLLRKTAYTLMDSPINSRVSKMGSINFLTGIPFSGGNIKKTPDCKIK